MKEKVKKIMDQEWTLVTGRKKDKASLEKHTVTDPLSQI
jgi:hypothetical protein